MFNSGISISKIAALLKRSEERVSFHLKKAGVWGGSTPTFTKEQISKMIEMKNSGLSLQHIGDEFGVSYNTIYHTLKKKGFDISVPMKNMKHQQAMVNTFDLVSADWWNEFRGFFYGEGTVGISWGSRGRGAIYLRITLRDDDSEALQHIRSVLGGKVSYSTPKTDTRNSNPNCMWFITGLSTCLAILEKLSDGVIPAKKRKDIEIAIEFCKWRLDCSRHLSAEQRTKQFDFRNRLKAIKVYRVVGQS